MSSGTVVPGAAKKRRGLGDALKFSRQMAVADSSKGTVNTEVPSSHVMSEESPEETVEGIDQPEILFQVKQAWKAPRARPPSAREKRGLRSFRIPKRAKAYVEEHLVDA